MKESSETQVYSFRWYIVLVSFLLHVSQMFTFLSYAPVANYADRFYGENTTTLCSVVFLAVPALLSIFAMWFGRRFGLRAIILYGSWATALGTGIRTVSGISSFSMNIRRAILITGQAIGSTGNPFAMFLPTKVAGAWFPGNQRALCTSIISISSPLGILFINLIVPRIVQTETDIFRLNFVTFAPAALTAILATVGVCNSSPPNPPSESATEESLEFKKGVFRLMTSRTFWILFICIGGGLGLFNGLYTTMEQLMCPKGYSNSFGGICIVLLIIGGLVGAIIAGVIVDKTKKFEQVSKISLALAVISGIAFSLILMQPGDMEIPLAVSCLFFGTFGMAFYAVGLEMSAECTYPVAETTSAGFVGLSGQLQGILYIFVMQKLATPIDREDFAYLKQVCTTGEDDANVQPKNMNMSMLMFSGIGAALALIFVLFFRPKYRRIQMETKRKALNAKQNGFTVPTAKPPTIS